MTDLTWDSFDLQNPNLVDFTFELLPSISANLTQPHKNKISNNRASTVSSNGVIEDAFSSPASLLTRPSSAELFDASSKGPHATPILSHFPILQDEALQRSIEVDSESALNESWLQVSAAI